MGKHRPPVPRARRGETFVEVLIALLITALATLLLAAMVGVSGSIDIAARKKDEEFYAALTRVEQQDTGAQKPEPTDPPDSHWMVTITDETAAPPSSTQVPVDVFNDDALTLYRGVTP